MNRTTPTVTRRNVPRIRVSQAALQLLQTKTPESGAKSEQLAMCHDSILINEALSAAHNAPDIREDRVAELRAKIATGQYQIDSMSIALGIIGENPELFR